MNAKLANDRKSCSSDPATSLGIHTCVWWILDQQKVESGGMCMCMCMCMWV